MRLAEHLRYGASRLVTRSRQVDTMTQRDEQSESWMHVRELSAKGNELDRITTDAGTPFSFEKFLEAFERIRYDEPPAQEPWPLPYLLDFIAALSAVAGMFQHLGAAFSFAHQDVVEKRDTLYRIYRSDPENYATIRKVIERETREGCLETGSGKQGAARNILRMMWCLKFIQVLMRELARCPAASYSKRAATRECVWTAYQEALREHHGSVVIAAVRAAVFFLPPIEQFLTSIGVEASRKDEYMRRVKLSLDPLVERLYAYYEHRNMLALP
jgi:hypothetical protein